MAAKPKLRVIEGWGLSSEASPLLWQSLVGESKEHVTVVRFPPACSETTGVVGDFNLSTTHIYQVLVEK